MKRMCHGSLGFTITSTDSPLVQQHRLCRALPPTGRREMPVGEHNDNNHEDKFFSPSLRLRV